MFDEIKTMTDREVLIVVHHMVKDLGREQKEQSDAIKELRTTHVTKEQFAPIASAVNAMQADHVTRQDVKNLNETLDKKLNIIDFEKFVKDDYVPFKGNTVTKDSVSPIRLIVYGAVGMILSFFGAGALGQLFGK